MQEIERWDFDSVLRLYGILTVMSFFVLCLKVKRSCKYLCSACKGVEYSRDARDMSLATIKLSLAKHVDQTIKYMCTTVLISAATEIGRTTDITW